MPARIRARVEGEARGLVRLEHLDARGGQQPENGGDCENAGGEQHRELPPAEADEEEDREERRRVHERGPEVGLHEHQEDRNRTEPDHREDRPPSRGRADAVDDEARDREHEEHLPELGRLELDDAEVEPALGAANRLGRDEDDDHQRQASPHRRASRTGARRRSGSAPSHEPDRADRSREALPDDEVALVAGTSKRVIPETTQSP